MAKPDVYQLRFMTGLGITNPIDLYRLQYAGGRNGYHANYWKLMFGDKPFPERQSKCVCGHDITENCFIMDEKGEFYVVGNKCIKRYLLKEKSGRTCEKCKAPHKNRKVNLCMKCR